MFGHFGANSFTAMSIASWLCIDILPAID